MPNQPISIFWFRRDLRLEDNVGLVAALQSGLPVLPVFIFDPHILDKLPGNDARVTFIHSRLLVVQAQLEALGSSLQVLHKTPKAAFKELMENKPIKAVFTNRDYEPYAIQRDKAIEHFLTKNQVTFHSFKDQVIFEQQEIVKNDGSPYVVYTAFKNKWLASLSPELHLKSSDTNSYASNFFKTTAHPLPTLGALGFLEATIKVPDATVTPEVIANYEATRNFPGIKQGTSRLGAHLRFGTVSIRELVMKARESSNKTFLSELIWREFFMQILWHFPHTVNTAFKSKYDRITWRNNEAEFVKWCEGQTGYALVDAGMRELNATGFMHNRVRMLVASFLCKHLLIDWRWGEAYFAERLLDYDQAANVGNWQWAAGSGVDAAPYFRIFNPMTQVEKFDKQKKYINRWVPELQEFTYTPMMVDHKLARQRCLQVYKVGLAQ